MMKRWLVLGLIVLLVYPVSAQETEPTEVYWMIGLGSGSLPDVLEFQQKVVEEFNAVHEDIELVLVVHNSVPVYDELATLLASQQDFNLIVGPAGLARVNRFRAHLVPLPADIDTSAYPPNLVEVYRTATGDLLALPYLFWPSVLYYNRDLFDAAGLPYPPHEWGQPYADGEAWTIEKMTEVAQQLTLDGNGNNALSPDFDPQHIVQYGYAPQWFSDLREHLVLFGAGALIDEAGQVVIPDHWRAALEWVYGGIWTWHFIPNQKVIGEFLDGNAFASGKVAMAQSHTWYTCCIGEMVNWDVAALPAYHEQITAKVHDETFYVMDTTQDYAAALEAMLYLMDKAELAKMYAGMPIRRDWQAPYVSGLTEQSDVDWGVAVEALNYVPIPSHEAYLPNPVIAARRLSDFQFLIESTGGLDLEVELGILVEDLQAIIDGANP